MGRNGRIGGAAVSCRELRGNGRNGDRIGAAVRCRELPGNGRNGERGGATLAVLSCQKISEMRRGGWGGVGGGGYEGLP